MEHQLSRQLQTSARDQGFRLMSALIGAASPEKKMDRTTKLRATTGTINVRQGSPHK